MNAISEFQIYIGSLDSQLNTELVNENEFLSWNFVLKSNSKMPRSLAGRFSISLS